MSGCLIQTSATRERAGQQQQIANRINCYDMFGFETGILLQHRDKELKQISVCGAYDKMATEKSNKKKKEEEEEKYCRHGIIIMIIFM